MSWRLFAQAEEVQDFAALFQALRSCRDGAHNDLSDGLAPTVDVKCLEIHGVLVKDEHGSVTHFSTSFRTFYLFIIPSQKKI